MKTILATLAMALFCSCSMADSVWTYTGNSTPDPLALSNPCQCSLSGSVTFDSSWNATSWDFTDGTHTLTQADSTGTLSPFYSGQQIGSPFRTWDISLTSLDGLLRLGTYNYGSGFEATDVSVANGSLFMNVQGHSGVWTDPPVGTPEPSSLLLLAAGLMAALTLKRLA